MIVEHDLHPPLLQASYERVLFDNGSNNDLMERRNINTRYDAMNETASTAILHELNEAMFVRLAPAVAFLALLMAVGVVGNLAICYIFGFKLGSNTQNFLLLSIGVFDLLSCTLGIPAEILDIRHYFLFESVELCKIIRFCTTFPTLSSIQVLLVIAADRYRKVCRPLYGQIELKHARLALAAIVLIAFVFSVPPLNIYGHRTFPTNVPGVIGRECSIKDEYSGGTYPIVYQVTLAGCFVVSTIALFIIYLHIWLETRRHRKYMKAHTMPSGSRQDNYSSSSEGDCANTENGSCVSLCTQRSALCRHVSNFTSRSFGRENRRSSGNEAENGAGHAQSWNNIELTSSSFHQSASFQSPRENTSLSCVSMSVDCVQTPSNVNCLPLDQGNTISNSEEASLVQDMGSVHSGESAELLPSHRSASGMEENNVFVSKAGNFSLRDDMQIGQVNTSKAVVHAIKDNSADETHPFLGKFSLGGKNLYTPETPCSGLHDVRQILEVTLKRQITPKIKAQQHKRWSLSNFSQPMHVAEVQSKRKCVSEDLKKLFSKEACFVPSHRTFKDFLAQSNAEENTSAAALLSKNTKKESFQSEEETVDDERVSFTSEDSLQRSDDSESRSVGGVRYQRLNKSQSQCELSASNSNSSLVSQLSAPTLASQTLISPRTRPKSTLSRMVVSKNMQRAKSNPMFIQASTNNLYKSRSTQSKISELTSQQGRSRSQSDPPARLHDSRYSGQSQPLTQLSKSKSKSNQSLTVQRVKKAFRATRATLIACTITTAFILSYLPHLSLAILGSVWISFEHQLDGASLVLYNIFLRSYFVNTAINVFVYGNMNREFRDEVGKMWERMKHICFRQKATQRA